MTRRAPIDDGRAQDAAERLERVTQGDHAADAGSPGETFLETLAVRKLSELLDETGGLSRAATSDPELDRMLRHELDLERTRWTDPRSS